MWKIRGTAVTLLLLGFIQIFLCATCWATPLPLSLNTSAELSSEGYFTLSWSSESDVIMDSSKAVHVEIAADPDFKQPIQHFVLGPLSIESEQVHLTGFKNGIYYSRLVQAPNSPISNSVQFRVQHRDLSVAFVIFAIGLALFVALTLTIVRFSQKGD